LAELKGSRTELDLAAEEWRSQLIDVGGNNRLLYFKKNASTIDFAEAASDGLSKLLAGEEVLLSKLFPEQKSYEIALKAAKSLSKKQKEALEEYGVPVAFMGIAMAEFPFGEDSAVKKDSEKLGAKSRTTNAPILLRAAEISQRRGSSDSWSLKLSEDLQLNGVLVHVLMTLGVEIDEDEILGSKLDEEKPVQMILKDFETKTKGISNLVIQTNMILGAFSYQKQPMVNDVTDLQVLAKSDLVSALAGVKDSIQKIRSIKHDAKLTDPDYKPVDSEFLILDADASQSYVVNATLGKQNLVVQGPPGTGKSQTIANVIAALAANGRSVLFVAQKRAAIEAVLNRLDKSGLRSLVLDAFLSGSTRRFVSEELRGAIENQRTSTPVEVSKLHNALSRSRDKLVNHNDLINDKVHGWGASIFELRNEAISVRSENRSEWIIDSSPFNKWSKQDFDSSIFEIEELATLGFFNEEWRNGPGWDPDKLVTNDLVSGMTSVARDLSAKGLPGLVKALTDIGQTDFKILGDVLEIHQCLEDLKYLSEYCPRLVDQTLNIEWLKYLLYSLDGWPAGKSSEKPSFYARSIARLKAKRLVKAESNEQRSEYLKAAIRLKENRYQAGINSLPESYPKASEVISEVIANCIDLQAQVRNLDLFGLPVEKLTSALRNLASDDQRLRMPKAFALHEILIGRGLDDLLSALLEEQTEIVREPESVSEAAKFIMCRSVLETAELESGDMSSTTGRDLDKFSKDFTISEKEHFKANAVRVLRIAAENLVKVLNSNPEQHLILKKEVTRKRNFMSIRRLFNEAPGVMLAAKPVWAMSPLQVSRFLPARQLFDVVIFDEASQIRPADAIPSLIRAKQVLVAGDTRQLPPTDFFSKVIDYQPVDNSQELDDLAEEETVAFGEAPFKANLEKKLEALTRDAESILFAFDRVLAGQSRQLLWHYRSLDERLIAVSNAHIYDSSLTTFPCADIPNAVRHIQAKTATGKDARTNSPQPEVEMVVKLVEEHLTNKPKESLGVITFGTPHQRRVEMALELAAKKNSKLAEALQGTGDEPFFVKSIERVQGDERDAIILSFGYGKDASGKLNLFWGPLLQDGGERRLNVAISRAKRSMTLLTSFALADLAEDRHSSPGFRLMYNFLKFAASGGNDLGSMSDVPPLNAFEIDVKKKLEAAGLILDCQVGVGSYRIDFAIKHPTKPDHYVLAVEADGASYHSGHTARERDRLRQSLLEQRGWIFQRIWSTDWFNNPDAEVERILVAYKMALKGESVEPESVADYAPMWGAKESKKRTGRPPIYPGSPIDEYYESTLLSLVKYVRSDGILRTREEEITELVRELGYAKRGAKIVRVLNYILDRS
jgi:very-short-patch-repair endonuclease